MREVPYARLTQVSCSEGESASTLMRNQHVNPLDRGGETAECTASEYDRTHRYPLTRAVRINPGLALCGQVIKCAQSQFSYSFLQRGHG
jgi:hypothetical protein